ncbi:lysoplasmalogenase TMEM86B-like [Nerophis lumbriciformis]|uniref:lysoplasmalogenase TMEM86B-like n=1 Tax=Nerophis lumbriciformis TaxID=546530 RepID=UPI002ADFD687|nr:lysoplasmalogenase TMEM86B-like [Nerophis lumbriciformis]
MDILETDADKQQKRNMSCAVLLSFSPFFLASATYFYLSTLDLPPSIMLAGVKSAPTLLLAVTVLGWNGCQVVPGVVGGLVFSAIGDFCLVWDQFFLYGKSLFLSPRIRVV